MKSLAVRSCALVAACIAGVWSAVPSQAAVLYDDGFDGTHGSTYIIVDVTGHSQAAADSFTLASASVLTGVSDLGLWDHAGGTPTGLSWEILTNAFPGTETVLASGTSTLASALEWNEGPGVNLFTASFSLPNISLPSGNYFLALMNGTDTNFNSLSWDWNINGSSTGWVWQVPFADAGVISYPHSFQIDGNTGSVPEPLTLSLFGAGLAGAVGMRRRKKTA